jgi:hypothetical protein
VRSTQSRHHRLRHSPDAGNNPVNTNSKWAYTLGVSASAIVALVLSFAMSGARQLSGIDALLLSATKRVLTPTIAVIVIIGFI